MPINVLLVSLDCFPLDLPVPVQMVLTTKPALFLVQAAINPVSLVMAVLQLIVLHVQLITSFTKVLALLLAPLPNISILHYELVFPVIISVILAMDPLPTNVPAALSPH